MEKTHKETCFCNTQICARCSLKGGINEKRCFPWLSLNWLPQWNLVIQVILIWPRCLGASRGMPFSICNHGSELGYSGDWVQILEAWPAVPALVVHARTRGPGHLPPFHFWYRSTYMLYLESPPYIFLSFLICQEGKERWGVNRMRLRPLSARFTCPLHSEHRLFAFLPGVTPVLTGRQESLCTPGQLDQPVSSR